MLQFLFRLGLYISRLWRSSMQKMMCSCCLTWNMAVTAFCNWSWVGANTTVVTVIVIYTMTWWVTMHLCKRWVSAYIAAAVLLHESYYMALSQIQIIVNNSPLDALRTRSVEGVGVVTSSSDTLDLLFWELNFSPELHRFMRWYYMNISLVTAS